MNTDVVGQWILVGDCVVWSWQVNDDNDASDIPPQAELPMIRALQYPSSSAQAA